MEMRHGGADHGVDVEVPVLESVRDFTHQDRDVVADRVYGSAVRLNESQ